MVIGTCLMTTTYHLLYSYFPFYGKVFEMIPFRFLLMVIMMIKFNEIQKRKKNVSYKKCLRYRIHSSGVFVLKDIENKKQIKRKKEIQSAIQPNLIRQLHSFVYYDSCAQHRLYKRCKSKSNTLFLIEMNRRQKAEIER